MNSFIIQNGLLVQYTGNDSDVVIPEEVTIIGENAFLNNLIVKRVQLTFNVKIISKKAFYGCSNLETILNNNQVIDYQDECFAFSGLKGITIYRNVQHIGKSAFSNMPNLEYVNYFTEHDLRLDYAFARCPKLKEVAMERNCFFPSFALFREVRNNPLNKRPTFGDAFKGTPYFNIINQKYMDLYKQGVCPECGGKIKKGLFHSVCQSCGIDFKN